MEYVWARDTKKNNICFIEETLTKLSVWDSGQWTINSGPYVHAGGQEINIDKAKVRAILVYEALFVEF